MVSFDNGFDTIVFRIDVPTGVTDQSFLLKTWKIFEYQPTFNSLLYSLASLSPPEDKRALALYNTIQRELPVAVPAKDNPDFWDAILGTVKEVSNLLPGPFKAVGKGVHAIGSAIHANNKQKKNNRSRTNGNRRNKVQPLKRKKKNRQRRRR